VSFENQLINVKFSIFPPSGNKGAEKLKIYRTLEKPKETF
jgi:hypothetical protein